MQDQASCAGGDPGGDGDEVVPVHLQAAQQAPFLDELDSGSGLGRPCLQLGGGAFETPLSPIPRYGPAASAGLAGPACGR